MKLLVVSEKESDLFRLFKTICDATLASCNEASEIELLEYDALAILGGTEEKPLIMNAPLREKTESFADSGKPIFLEYVGSFRCVYSAQPTEALPHRLVCKSDFAKLSAGDLLDSRCNSYIRPHFLMPNTEILMYYKKYTPAHDNIASNESEATNGAAFFRYDNVIAAAFRMCDWLKGAVAPKARWESVVSFVCEFLGADAPAAFGKNSLEAKRELRDSFENELNACIDRALTLLDNFLVAPDGSKGIYEGLSHNILPNGKRLLSTVIRTDCIGEAAGAFLFSGDTEKIEKAEKMYNLCYGPLVVKNGDFAGMMRWSEEAWNVCYQDDVARTVIPSLLYSYFGLSDKYLPDAKRVLRFLCDTTCKDGLRPARTDVLEYLSSEKSVFGPKNQEHGLASAHYNSWYSAALLLCYLVCGEEEYFEVGRKGLETLMSLYPETVREHSETGELCRLIFPLSVLYKASGKKEHYDMLDRVFNDLTRLRHESGGYAEWDTGYRSSCFNNAGGECSLLAQNGDPVADLLYSLNWLPLGFAFAFHVTHEMRFATAWRDICEFFIKAQVISENNLLNGAWCRGIDLNRFEYFGIPHDVGWGPCCVETGWTVSEITTGMLIGKGIINGALKH